MAVLGYDVDISEGFQETSHSEQSNLSCRLWVGNLDFNARKTDLEEAFRPYGRLKSVLVMMEKSNPNRSRGYGFVEYHNSAEAARAQQNLNESLILSRIIQVNCSTPKGFDEDRTLASTPSLIMAGAGGGDQYEDQYSENQYSGPNSARLFVGNLDFNVREEDLRKSFDKFGRIQSCIIIMDRDQPSKSRGFGFVQYNFASHAERAAAALNGTKFMGREIRVNIAAPKGSSDLEHKERFRQSKKDVPNFSGGNASRVGNGNFGGNPRHKAQLSRRIYVGNLDYEVRERHLEPLFEKYGRIIRAQVMFESDNPSKSRGYGFVEFDSSESANQAAADMNDYMFMGRNMRVNMATYRNQGQSNNSSNKVIENYNYEDQFNNYQAPDTMPQGADFDFAGPAQDLAEANANALTAADLHNPLLGQTPAQQQLLQQKAKEQDLINAAANGAAPYSQNLLTKPLFANQTSAGSQTSLRNSPSQAKHFEPYETEFTYNPNFRQMKQKKPIPAIPEKPSLPESHSDDEDKVFKESELGSSDYISFMMTKRLLKSLQSKPKMDLSSKNLW